MLFTAVPRPNVVTWIKKNDFLRWGGGGFLVVLYNTMDNTQQLKSNISKYSISLVFLNESENLKYLIYLDVKITRKKHNEITLLESV